jgi:hypothetical protein
MKILIPIFLIVFVLLSNNAQAEELMLHIVFTSEGTIQENTIGINGEIWRVSTNRLKMKTNEGIYFGKGADAWYLDSATNRAIHSFDEGPSINIMVPIFQNPKSNAISQTQPPYGTLEKLEFGNEVDFFSDHGGDNNEKEKLLYRQIEIGGFSLKLFLDESATPKGVLIEGPHYYLRFNYLVYEKLPILVDSFFDPPVNVSYEEVEN